MFLQVEAERMTKDAVNGAGTPSTGDSATHDALCCRCGWPLPGDEPCFETADGRFFHFVCGPRYPISPGNPGNGHSNGEHA